MQIVTAPAAGAAASYDVLAVLRDSLMGAATGALPYIGVGAAAGVVVMAVVWGVTAAVRAFRNAGYVEHDNGDLYFNGDYVGNTNDEDEYDHHSDDSAWDLANDPGYFEPQGEWMPFEDDEPTEAQTRAAREYDEEIYRDQ